MTRTGRTPKPSRPSADRADPKSRYGQLASKNLTLLLPYWEIYEGIVFLKDGSVEFGIEVFPKPDVYLEEYERERIVAAFHQIIAVMPEKTRLRIYYESQKATLESVREYLLTKKNPNPVIQRMVKERAKMQVKEALGGHRLRWSMKLTLFLPTMVAPASGNLLLDFISQVRLLLGNTPKGQAFVPLHEEEFARVLHEVNQIRDTMVGILQDAGLSASPMDNDSVYTTIFRWLNPDPLRSLRYDPPREFYLPEEIKRRKLDPKTLRRQVAQTPLWATAMDFLYKYPEDGEGTEFLSIYEMTVPPKHSFWNAVYSLLAPTPMAVVIDVYKRPQEETKGYLSRTFTRKFRSSRSGDAPEASDLTQEGVILQALTRAETGEMFVDFSASVVIRADTLQDLERIRREYEASVKAPQFGGSFRRLKENLFFPYMNLLPFAGRRQKMSFFTLSMNAALFLANAGPWSREGGRRVRPMVVLSNRYLGLVPIDLFDPAARSWNAVVVGSTGSGKTFTALTLLSEALADDENTEIIIVDKKGDYEPWVRLMGGAVIDIAPGAGITLNMFDVEHTFFTEPPADLPGEEKLGFLQKLFHILLGKPHDPNLALKEQMWMEAVRSVYRANTEPAYNERGEMVGYSLKVPTLRQVINTVRALDEVGKNALSDEQKVIARQLATELTSWLIGPMAEFLDGETNLKGDNQRLVYFNLAGLDELKSDLYIALALALISNRIYGRLRRAPRDVKKFVVFDEAHALFRIPEGAALVVDLYRRARSYGAAVWTLTQTIAEYKGPHVQGILETTNIFMFVNSVGQEEAISEILSLPKTAGATAGRLERRQGVFNEMLYLIRTESGGLEGDVLRIYPTSWDVALFSSSHDLVSRRSALAKQLGSLYQAIVHLAKPKEEEDILVEALQRGALTAEEVRKVFQGGVGGRLNP